MYTIVLFHLIVFRPLLAWFFLKSKKHEFIISQRVVFQRLHPYEIANTCEQSKTIALWKRLFCLISLLMDLFVIKVLQNNNDFKKW